MNPNPGENTLTILKMTDATVAPSFDTKKVAWYDSLILYNSMNFQIHIGLLFVQIDLPLMGRMSTPKAKPYFMLQGRDLKPKSHYIWNRYYAKHQYNPW